MKLIYIKEGEHQRTSHDRPVVRLKQNSAIAVFGVRWPCGCFDGLLSGQLSYASCGVGTSHHIAGEMFKSEADVDIQHIAYKGCSPALSDVLGGHIPIFFQTISNITQQMETDKIRVLAVLDPERLQAYPDLPTMSETPGMADFTVTPWYGIFAPGGTPGTLLEKISADIEKVMATPELQESFAQKYYRVETIPPREFSDLVKTDIDRLGKVIKNAGMSAN